MKKLNTEEAETREILIVDDHKMVRDGLRMMLASLRKLIWFNIDEATCGEEAIRKAGRKQFDIILMDYQMPGISGAETIRRVLRCSPGLPILALSNYFELSYIQDMMDAGARGYVLKDIERAELLNAIKTLMEGGLYYCSDVAVKLLEWKEIQDAKKTVAQKILTPRETEVLQMIAMECTNDEIAAKLFVSKRTVDTHRQNLINKLRAKNTVGLIKAAYKLHLITN